MHSVDASDHLQAALARNRLPHRPFKIIYATLYYDVRPTFVVDITDQFEARFQALMAYKTQFSDQEAGRVSSLPRTRFDRALKPWLVSTDAGRRDLCRAVFAEGSWVGGRPYTDSGQVDLVRAALPENAGDQTGFQFLVPSSQLLFYGYRYAVADGQYRREQIGGVVDQPVELQDRFSRRLGQISRRLYRSIRRCRLQTGLPFAGVGRRGSQPGDSPLCRHRRK